MVRVDATELSVDGTWIDGYLPTAEALRQMAESYRHMDDALLSPGEHGFHLAYERSKSGKLLPGDLAAGLAAAFRSKFDHDSLPPRDRPVPCCMWLFQSDRESHDPRMKPLYEEYLADPGRDDYYHLVSIRRECSADDECLQRVLDNLRFEQKSEDGYKNRERFLDSVRELLAHYVDIMAAPWLEIERLLQISTSSLARGGD